LGDRSATTPIAAAKEDAFDMRAIEREHILQVLRTVNGSRRRAVELLGISERALRYKLKSYREEGHVVS
jgi:two-component system response regulator FlrC